jgi:hypothetical protein
MRSNTLRAALLVVAVAFAGVVQAQEAKVYSEGPVVDVSYVKIKPGMFDAYMKWVATDRKAYMEELKKAGIILDWRVYGSQARSPNDPDLILTVTYKNMAAFDGLEARTDAIQAKLAGSMQKANEMAISRESMREVLGGEMIRELIIK